ncbi:MAG: ribbon-helix-helix protein, CopG family [Chloroflexi bacterium]|nr:MAG: ribbon-helix-helix protein, CopG family [Chloroflexota bacterium]
MIKSFRLTPELEGRLEKAAARAGVSVSDFIREAVQEKCDGVLGGRTLLDMLGDTVGAVEGGGGIDSGHTGREFADLMVEKYRGKRVGDPR